MKKKITVGSGGLLLAVMIAWFSGPKAAYPPFDNEPLKTRWSVEHLDSIIAEKEKSIEHLKEDNQARVIWADTIKAKTEYSIVYIHGFSASQGEGEPIHRLVAKEMNANLYLARLRDHGLDNRDAFREATPGQWIADAKEAIAIGKSIGDKVILMSCSTGGTLSIYLAAQDTELHSLILLSPNIAIYDKNARMLTGPWGESIAEQLIGEYREVPREKTHPYWSGTYHTNGLIALQALIDNTMKEEIFSKISLPVFMGYYYKNDEEQDKVVSVKAMLEFYDEISTPTKLKRKVAFASAGNHVISSQFKNDNWEEVLDSTLSYLRFIRDLPMIEDQSL